MQSTSTTLIIDTCGSVTCKMRLSNPLAYREVGEMSAYRDNHFRPLLAGSSPVRLPLEEPSDFGVRIDILDIPRVIATNR